MWRVLLVCAGLTAVAQSDAQSLDAVEAERAAAVGFGLRWDNVEGPPVWRAGIAPRYDRSRGRHTVTLSPGESTLVQLPRDAEIRLETVAGSPDEHLRVEATNGSGLFVVLDPVATLGGDRVFRRSRFGPYDARVSLAPEAPAPVAVALYASRRVTAAPPVSYDRPLTLAAAAETVREHGRLDGARYWRVEPRAGLEFTLSGPARYRLDAHMPAVTDAGEIARSGRMSLTLDDEVARVFTFPLSPERRRVLRVDGEPRLLGRGASAYFAVPEGLHAARIDSPAGGLVRLRGEREARLLERLNRPPAATAPRELFALRDGRPGPAHIRRALRAADVNGIAHAAAAAAWDNRYREGGLLARNVLLNAASRMPQYPALRGVATRLEGRYTRLRDLMPETPAEFAGAWPYIDARLRDPRDFADRLILDGRRLGDYAARTPRGRFYTLKPDRPIRYLLPPREFDSEIVVVVARPEGGAEQFIELLFDGQPGHALRLEPAFTPGPDRSAVTLSASMRELSRSAPAFSATAAGYLAYAPDAASAALPLPAGVGSVTLRSASAGSALAVALRYRVSRTHRLSAADLLAALRDVDAGFGRSRLFTAGLQRLDALLAADDAAVEAIAAQVPVHARAAAGELLNEWMPMYRFLRRSRDLYTADIASVMDAAPDAVGAIDPELRARLQRARAAREWFPALEAAVRLARVAHGPDRIDGCESAGAALAQLGEPFLAEQWWRSCLIFAKDDDVRNVVFEKLLRLYTTGRQWAKRGQLLAYRAVDTANPDTLRSLFDHFYAIGDYEHALALGLVLPDSADLVTAVAQAAVATGRNELAAQVAAGAPGAAEHRLGSTWPGGLGGETARDAAAAIAANRHAVALGGPREWREVAAYARAHAGWRPVASPAREQVSQRLLATPSQPLRLTVPGPIRLRFDLRLLHPAEAAESRDAWITLHHDGRRLLAPVSGDRPVPGLSPVSGGWPGRRSRFELSLEAGVHELKLAAEAADVLVGVYAERPVVLEADFDDMLASWVARGAGSGRAAASTVRCATISGSELIECRDAPGAPDSDTAATTPVRADAAAVPAAIIALPPVRPFVGEGETVPADDYARAVRLVRQWERGPERQRAALVGPLSALGERNPLDAAIQGLVRRVGAETAWQTIDYVADSAGVRFVQRPVSAIESPSLRARAALLPQRCRDGRLVTASTELSYAVFNVAPRDVELELSLCEPLVFPSEQLQVELDTGRARDTLTLDAATPTLRRRVRLGVGERTVRLRLVTPAVNQFLGVKINDPAAEPGDLQTQEVLYHVATKAEPVRLDIEGPAWIRLDTLRPAGTDVRYLDVPAGWQQIELEPRAGEREALYRLHQRVTEDPAAPSRPRHETVAQAPVPAPLLPSALLPVATPPTPPAEGLTLGGQEDGTPGAGLRLVSRTRVDDEEGSTGGGRLRENFLEWQLHHRAFHPRRELYTHLDAVVRVREEGGPSFGAAAEFRAHPLPAWPWFGTRISLGAMLQSPGSELPGRDNGLEWRVTALGEVFAHHRLAPRLHHVPRVALFGSELSLDRNDYRAGVLDRDVFSRYKAQHRHWLRLSDRISWRPWLDSEWFGRFRVSSNEDFDLLDPDNVELRTGWRQLVGEIDLGLHYSHQHFLADDDRRKASNRREIVFSVNWLKWRRGPGMLEARFTLNHNLSADDNSAQLTFRWHGGNGRGARDFAPGEIRFGDQRWRAQRHDANPAYADGEPRHP